jgi:NAD(P)-dependent dehydrogenase (short-subunit alcohol dehydrogenase family)
MRVLLGARDPAKGKVAADTQAREGIVVQTVIHGRDGCGERQRRCRASRFDHVLVNNAGVDYDTDQTALAADLVRVRRILETNLLGAWIVAGAFAPGMRERGWGRIVNVSRGAGSLAEMRRGPPGYNTSKAARYGRQAGGRCGMGPRVCWVALLPDDGPSSGFFRDGKPVAW